MGCHVIAAFEQGMSLGGGDQRETGAGAGAEFDQGSNVELERGGFAGRSHEVNNIAFD